MIAPVTSYLTNMGRALSRLGNAFVGGYSGEMVSARVYREGRHGWVRFLDRCFFWEPNHCQECYLTEMLDADRPLDYHHVCSKE